MFRNRDISPEDTLLCALKKMDSLDRKLLIVLKKQKFVGLISAGDIQRAIIKDISLSTPVKKILRKTIRVAQSSDSLSTIKNMMIEYRMEFCPVINDQKEVKQIYFWEDLFIDQKPEPKKNFHLPIVIMAGGKGTRLKPLTNVLPKPLIPLKEKSIIEEIFDHFGKHGCFDYYISVNYKADLIDYYIKSLNLKFNIEIYRESKPLGTAGSLSLLKGKINQTFFVTNCDILIDQDYSEILDYHYSMGNEMTLVAALKHYPIPYGTIETGENGKLINLTEKPEIMFKVNSGMYILEPHLLDEIPEDRFFHITQLIESIKNRNGKLGVFPINEKSWIDIGDWKTYFSII